MRKAVNAQDVPTPPAGTDGPPHLIDGIEMHKKMLEAATARIDPTEDVTKALYVVLTDDQKRIADRFRAPPPPPGLAMRGGPHGAFSGFGPGPGPDGSGFQGGPPPEGIGFHGRD